MKKADEMEMTLNFSAMRLSWAFANLYLIVWVLFELIKSGTLVFLPFLLILMKSLIFFGYKLYLSKKMIR